MYLQENRNDSLRVVVAYHRLPLPLRGDTIQFQPLEHLSPIEFTRRGGISRSLPDAAVDLKTCRSNLELAEVCPQICTFCFVCAVDLLKCRKQ